MENRNHYEDGILGNMDVPIARPMKVPKSVLLNQPDGDKLVSWLTPSKQPAPTL